MEFPGSNFTMQNLTTLENQNQDQRSTHEVHPDPLPWPSSSNLLTDIHTTNSSLVSQYARQSQQSCSNPSPAMVPIYSSTLPSNLVKCLLAKNYSTGLSEELLNQQFTDGVSQRSVTGQQLPWNNLLSQNNDFHSHQRESPTIDVSSAGHGCSSMSGTSAYTTHQASSWNERFLELLQFKQQYGHCCVPSHWPQNPSLAQWVKRQRSQRKLKQDGKHSNMTSERERSLDEIQFVWDSHSASWENRLNELREFSEKHGHANVPGRDDEYPQLAVWCKCQRRMFKLYKMGDKRSSLTWERITKLLNIGFEFDPLRARKLQKVM